MIKSDRANNFDLLRLLAALQVVHSHAVEHLHIGYGQVGRALTDLASFFPGVPIFFVISGFLISRAFERSSGVGVYARNRMLRIYPALWVCFAASLALLAAFGVLTRAVLASPESWAWIAGQLTFVQFFNPGVFRGFGVGVLNGSLWTIPVELQFYVAVPFIYYCFVKGRHAKTANALVAGLAALSVVAWCVETRLGAGTVAAKLVQVTLAPHLFMFLTGLLLQRNWSSVSRALTGRGARWAAAYVVFRLVQRSVVPAPLTGWAVAASTAVELTSFALLAFTVLSLAYTGRSASRQALRGHDLSYGVYLYHMLVVNACVQMGLLGMPRVLLGVFAATLAAAAASWLVVERPALQAKAGRFLLPANQRAVFAPPVPEVASS